jgi:hypothetical protein
MHKIVIILHLQDPAAFTPVNTGHLARLWTNVNKAKRSDYSGRIQKCYGISCGLLDSRFSDDQYGNVFLDMASCFWFTATQVAH